MRTSTIKRKTNETDIEISLNLDGSRKRDINVPIPFFKHMLDALSFYANWDISIKATGDIDVDDHHLVEDIGIVLGQCFISALTTRDGITRFSSTLTPMDEALARVVVDISNRPTLVYDANYERRRIGGLSLENIKEFLYAFCVEARITLHTSILYGSNDHHKVEALFKGLGRALRIAAEKSDTDVISTKGVL